MRLWRLGDVALLPDEAYYWLWSTHPAPAYMDHPAGIALLIRLSTTLGGSSEIGIRWLNAVLGIGCVILVYALAKQAFSRAAAILAAGVMAAGAPFIILSRFVFTDTLLIFAVLLNIWLLAPVLAVPARELSWGRALAAGLSFILLMNTKYTACAYAAGLVTFVLVFRRDLTRSSRVWLMAALAATGLLPVLLWNAAHDWISFRWQFLHVAGPPLVATSLPERAGNAIGYLTLPLIIFALTALFHLRHRPAVVFLLPGFLMMAPGLMSPTDSPRNLAAGLSLWIIPAAGVWVSSLRGSGKRWGIPIIAGFFLILIAYGGGTVTATFLPLGGPQSSAAATIRADASGWRDAAGLGLSKEAALFTLDYSIASQLSYYSGRSVFTSWWQYRHWGKPPLNDIQILSLSHVDPGGVSARLREAFSEFQGPERRRLGPDPGGPIVLLWRARGPRVDVDTFLDMFDFVAVMKGRDGK